MAEKDKVRYQNEMKDYTPPKGTGSKLSKKNSKGKKDPNAPKRPMTAFMLYSNATRAKVKADNPGISFGDVVSTSLWSYLPLYDLPLFGLDFSLTLYTPMTWRIFLGKETGWKFQESVCGRTGKVRGAQQER